MTASFDQRFRIGLQIMEALSAGRPQVSQWKGRFLLMGSQISAFRVVPHISSLPSTDLGLQR
jgi:hypothetical protein